MSQRAMLRRQIGRPRQDTARSYAENSRDARARRASNYLPSLQAKADDETRAWHNSFGPHADKKCRRHLFMVVPRTRVSLPVEDGRVDCMRR